MFNDHQSLSRIIDARRGTGRLLLFFQERIEEVTTLKDEIPGRVRYPGRSREIEYARKHIES